MIKLNKLLNESNYNDRVKPVGGPLGKTSFMKIPLDMKLGEYPPSWKAKMIYWRKKIKDLIGYEVLE